MVPTKVRLQDPCPLGLSDSIDCSSCGGQEVERWWQEGEPVDSSSCPEAIIINIMVSSSPWTAVYITTAQHLASYHPEFTLS